MKRNLQPQLRRTRPYQASNKLHNPVGSPDLTHTICYVLAREAFSHLVPSYHLGNYLPYLGLWPDPFLGEEVPSGSLVTHNMHFNKNISVVGPG